MITGVSHVALNVTNMEQALGFYCDVLGFQHAFDIPNERGENWICYVKVCDGAFLELFYGGIRDREKAYDFGVDGYHHCCISVGDIRSLAWQLFEKGVLREPVPTHNKDGNLGLWIEDPDGNALEIVEYTPESPLMKSNRSSYAFSDGGFTGIGHVSFVVADMDRSMEYYGKGLGFQPVLALNDDEGKPFLNFLRIRDGTYLELFYGGNCRLERGANSFGGNHICLECDDVAQTVKTLEGRGIPIDIQPKQGVDNNVQAWINDPDGNRFELMSIDPHSPQANA